MKEKKKLTSEEFRKLVQNELVRLHRKRGEIIGRIIVLEGELGMYRKSHAPSDIT